MRRELFDDIFRGKSHLPTCWFVDMFYRERLHVKPCLESLLKIQAYDGKDIDWTFLMTREGRSSYVVLKTPEES